MPPYNHTTCEEYRDVVLSVPYKVVIFYQGIALLIPVYGIISLIRFFVKEYAPMHINTKILVGARLLFQLGYNISTLIPVYFYGERLFSHDDDCKWIHSTEHCSASRQGSIFTVIGMSSINVGLMMNSLLATKYPHYYEKQKTSKRAIGFVIVSLVVATLLSTVVFHAEDPNEFMTYCISFSSSPSIAKNVYELLAAVFVVNVIVMYVSQKTALYNRKMRLDTQFTNLCEDGSDYLNTKYQLGENEHFSNLLTHLVAWSTFSIAGYCLCINIFFSIRTLMGDMTYKPLVLFCNPMILDSLVITIMINKGLDKIKKRTRRVVQASTSFRDNIETAVRYSENLGAQWSAGYDALTSARSARLAEPSNDNKTTHTVMATRRANASTSIELSNMSA